MRYFATTLFAAIALVSGVASAQPPAAHVAAPSRIVEPTVQPHAMRSSYPTTPTSLKGPLFDERPRATDPVQGEAGDCFFVSAMSAVAQKRPDVIRSAITVQPDGNYRVRLYENKKDSLGRERLVPVDVIVDKSVPSHEGTPAYATGHAGSWPAIVEKAFASMKGSYTKIGNGGFGKDALEALTGKRATDIWFDDPKDAPKAIDKLEAAVKDGRPALAATRMPKDFISVIANARKKGTDAEASEKLVEAANPDGGKRLVEAMAKYGMVPGHQYTVFGIGERDGKKMIVLRNPHGELSPATTGIGTGVREGGRGVFALPADEFALLFDSVVFAAPDAKPN